MYASVNPCVNVNETQPRAPLNVNASVGVNTNAMLNANASVDARVEVNVSQMMHVLGLELQEQISDGHALERVEACI